VARFSYAYALALDGVGRKSAALEVLRSAHARDPRDVEVLYALATMHRDAGQLDQAIHYATELNRLAPDDHSGQALLRELQDPPRRRGR
jgi:Flp pilus assembly protein TadD